MKKISAKDISIEFVIRVKIPKLKNPIELRPPFRGKTISIPFATEKGLKRIEIDTYILQKAIWDKCIEELAWWKGK